MVDLIKTKREFGSVLASSLREKYGSLDMASVALGIDQATLYAYIDGVAFPSLPARLNFICDKSGVDVTSLHLPSLVKRAYHYRFGIGPQNGENIDSADAVVDSEDIGDASSFLQSGIFDLDSQLNLSSMIRTRVEFASVLERRLREKYGSLYRAAKDLSLGDGPLDKYIHYGSFPRTREKLDFLCRASSIDVRTLDLTSLVGKKFLGNFGLTEVDLLIGNEPENLEGMVEIDLYEGEEPALSVSLKEKITDRKTFGQILRAGLISRFGNLSSASKQLSGINYGVLCHYVRGNAFPKSREQIEQLCQAAGLSISSLDLFSLISPKFRHKIGIENYKPTISVISVNADKIPDYKEELKAYSIGENGNQGLIVGNSRPMLELFRLLDKIVNNPDQNSVVLITGETGTGKELVARAIHYNGPRAKSPFLGVNITALPETLLESELFGHSRGAYTGAVSDAKGFFEEAGDGTLFLDEIGSMIKPAQARLLRVLQEREFYRIGEVKTRKFSGRVLVATREKLEELVRNGDFREDLYYRINVVNVHLPTLMERREDIPLLFSYFVRQHNLENGTNYSEELSTNARERVNLYTFPGNIRELQNLIRRAIFFNSDSEQIRLETVLPVNFKAKSPEQS